jgi:hypothetical protein
MTYKKWSLTATLSLLILAACGAAPGAAVAQTGSRGVRVPAPRNDRRIVVAGVGAVSIIPRGETAGVVGVLPRNESEFGYIYGRRPTAAEVDNMVRTQVRLSRMNQSNLEFRPEARTAEGFERYAKEGPERFVIVAGHNENGEFRFADGGSRSLSEIVKSLNSGGKEAIVLSCGALDYVNQTPAASGLLSDRDVLKITERIGDRLGGSDNSLLGGSPRLGGNDLGDFQSIINQVEAGASRTKVALVAGGLVGAGGAAYVMLPERKGKRR